MPTVISVSYGKCISVFLVISIKFFIVALLFAFQPTFSQAFVSTLPLDHSCLIGVRWDIVVLIWSSLEASDAKHLVMHFLVICVSSFENILLSSFFHLFTGLVDFLLILLVRCWYSLYMNSSLENNLENIFFPFSQMSPHCAVSFEVWKLWSLITYFFSFACALWVLFKKSSPIPMC